MTNRPQVFLRSSTPGQIPAAGTRLPGELWTTFPDKQLGVIDASKTAQPMIAVRFFSTAANYASGDFVVQAGGIWVANTSIAAGAFNPGQWRELAYLTDVPAAYVLPTASPTVLGGVKIDNSSITIASGVISATPSAPYILPPASTTILGGVKVDGTTISATGAGVISAPGAAPQTNPNRLDNGDMWVDQHNGGASVLMPAIGAVITDRWWFGASKASKVTLGQNYTNLPKPLGFQYFLGAQTTAAVASPAATDFFQLYQGIEADAVSDLMFGTANAQPVTLSFWVCSSLTGTFGASLTNYGSTRCYIFNYSISAANTPTKITIAIPGDTVGTWVASGSAGAFLVMFDLGSGANYRTATLNAWTNGIYYSATGAVSVVSTLNAKWAITGVKLEAGSVATSYPVEDLARKLARCQRYYQTGDLIWSGNTTSGATYYANSPFGINMRAAPSVVLTSVGNTNFTGPGSLAGAQKTYFQIGVVATATGSGFCEDAYTASAEI